MKIIFSTSICNLQLILHIITSIIKEQLTNLRESGANQSHIYRKGNALYINGTCQILSQGNGSWEVLVDSPEKEVIAKLAVNNEELSYERRKPENLIIKSRLQIISTENTH